MSWIGFPQTVGLTRPTLQICGKTCIQLPKSWCGLGFHAGESRSIHATSPYLLQHADNPVHWHEWGPEALARARAEDKPIFLSIGYAACHWCHVMAHESFEDPAIAAIMNEHFVNIKVDREERPDIDSIYMEAVVALTGRGGWPMSVFLTPEGEPFYGGTYFPPDERYGMPSFRRVLTSIIDAWEKQRSEIDASAANLRARLVQTSQLKPQPGDRSTISSSAALSAVARRSAAALLSAPCGSLPRTLSRIPPVGLYTACVRGQSTAAR